RFALKEPLSAPARPKPCRAPEVVNAGVTPQSMSSRCSVDVVHRNNGFSASERKKHVAEVSTGYKIGCDRGRSWEVHMDSLSSPGGSPDYLESLMRAGQEATRQFDDALVAAMGIEGKTAKSDAKSPFAYAASLQQLYWMPVLDFWRAFFNGKPPAGADLGGRAARGD